MDFVDFTWLLELDLFAPVKKILSRNIQTPAAKVFGPPKIYKKTPQEVFGYVRYPLMISSYQTQRNTKHQKKKVATTTTTKQPPQPPQKTARWHNGDGRNDYKEASHVQPPSCPFHRNLGWRRWFPHRKPAWKVVEGYHRFLPRKSFKYHGVFHGKTELEELNAGRHLPVIWWSLCLL